LYDILDYCSLGTDIGRLHDILEDFKTYAEPVIFTLLSMIFPTIRFWSHDTTSSVIEWFYQLNSFLGLQGEAEYYRTLVERVLELAEEHHDNESVKHSPSIVLCGHSLGNLTNLNMMNLLSNLLIY
jgi:hypothetical protein